VRQRRAMLIQGNGSIVAAHGIYAQRYYSGGSCSRLIVAFSLVVNSAIPFALALVPPPGGWNWDVFGGAAGASLFGVVFPQVKAITPVGGAVEAQSHF